MQMQATPATNLNVYTCMLQIKNIGFRNEHHNYTINNTLYSHLENNTSHNHKYFKNFLNSKHLVHLFSHCGRLLDCQPQNNLLNSASKLQEHKILFLSEHQCFQLRLYFQAHHYYV